MRYDDVTSLSFAPRIALVLATASSIASAASCGDEGASRHLGARGDGGNAPVHAGGSPNDAAREPPMATMRIAHLAPGTGPIDFCYQPPTSGTFVGPVLSAPTARDAGPDADDLDGALPPATEPDASDDLDDDDGGTSLGLEDGELRPASYRTVSKYLNVQGAGRIRIAVIAAGATSCANALAIGDVTLDPGKLATVVVFGRRGDGGMALEIGAFIDDRTTEPDKIRVRIVHAALGDDNTPAADAIAVRAVGATTAVLADRVEPRRAATPSQPVGVDNLGYVTAPPMSPPVAVAIGPAPTSGGADGGFDPWLSAPKDLELRGGSLHTGFVLTGASASTFELVWCADTTTSGAQTKCELLR